MTNTITQLIAREILDSRGNPTVEAELHLSQGQMVSACVPSGASTGKYEAIELRDQDPHRFGGKGTLKAVKNINETIAPLFIGKDPTEQGMHDETLQVLDGTLNKKNLGANATLAVSLVLAKAGAVATGLALHDYLAQEGLQTLPAPMMNVINGGAHADNGLNIQEFMIMPLGFEAFHEALRAGAETFQALKKVLSSKKL